MTQNDYDRYLFEILQLVTGGRLRVKRNGIDTIFITHNGVDPEIDIRDIDSLKTLLPPITPSFLERMRQLSKEMATANRNVRISSDGDLFLNMGSRGTVIKDLEGFAELALKRADQLMKNRRLK